jgi:hypothetical protein
MAPATRYARSGDANIAFQVHGDGPVDVLLLTGMLSNVETLWEEPGLARAFDRIAAFGRLILMDRAGSGCPTAWTATRRSTRTSPTSTRCSTPRAARAPPSSARPPGRRRSCATRRQGPSARARSCSTGRSPGPVRTDELPWLDTAEERRQRMAPVLENWGQGVNADLLAVSVAGDPGVRAVVRAAWSAPRCRPG